MSSRPGDSIPVTNATPVATATHATAGETPIVGSVYRGIVEERSGDGSYKVRLEAPRADLAGVLLAAPVFGGLLGYNVRCRITPGTAVEISYGTPSFIHAVIPRNTDDWMNAKNRSMMWGDAVEAETGMRDNYSEAPEDMVEGEVEIGNMFGVAMSFLTTLIKMGAGDRAAVECHLINDMVRVISSQYRHFSGIGDELIFDHGRPTLERGWSSYRHEVLGKLQEKMAFADMAGDAADKAKLEAARVTAAGRHRLIEFIGFAGDFIHSFVADPTIAEAKLEAATDHASGKSWIHRNSDGTVLIQSVADIRLERVCRIPVPARIASHEDQTITRNRQYENLNKEFVTLPDLGSLAKKDAFRAAYHLRSYSRWMSRYHAFARMLQMDEEYQLKSESGTAAPSWANLEADKEAANAAVEYYDTFACFTILRDGSIVMQDGYGGSLVFSNGNVQISAARHMDIEAAGDIRMVAGGSLYLKSKRNIEISATCGGIILHGYAWFKALCEKGSMWLRSNADTRLDAPELEPHPSGGPLPEVAENMAILFEAPRGSAALRTDGQIVIMTDGSPADDDDESKDVRIHSKGGVTVNGRKKVTIQSPTDVEIQASRAIALASSCVITNAYQIIAGDGSLMFQGGKLYVTRIETLSLKSNSVSSLSDKMAKFKPEKKVVPPAVTNDAAIEALERAKDLAKNPPTVPWANALEGPQWGFSAPEEYVWDTRDQEVGEVAETLTQQYLRLDVSSGDAWSGPGYETWSLSAVPAGGLRMKKTGGFGSWETSYRASDSGANLRTPSAENPKDMDPLVIQWEAAGKLTMKALKRS